MSTLMISPLRWFRVWMLVNALPLAAVTNSITIYEIDNAARTDQPISIGRVFAQGEIAACPQPVGDQPIASYQADVKNRWPDGSAKFAVVTFTQTLKARGSATIRFQNSPSCNNTGFLTQSQMVNFNGGNWGADIEVTAPGQGTKVVDAKAMLQSLSFADCQLTYWLQGPVVTQVLVQDCTSGFKYDFGWKWDGTSMTVSSDGKFQSLHPIFILSFYPGLNSVKVDYIMENMWSVKTQDQLYDYVLKAGSPLSPVLSRTGARKLTANVTGRSNVITAAGANFTPSDVGSSIRLGNSWSSTICAVTNATTARLCTPANPTVSGTMTVYLNLHIGLTRWRKTFWSGTPAGKVRIDHNFPYLISTKALPNYDPRAAIDPSRDYAAFAAGDKGDIGGMGMAVEWGPGYSNNHEGAPLQREDLAYLYNMADCGKSGGRCAKAWYVLTGERGNIDNGLAASVPGGAGVWNNQGNIPYHSRESRDHGSFYCAGYADKNATPASGCGPTTITPVGRPLSRHAHPRDGQFLSFGPETAVGTQINPPGGWTPECSHWLDYSYVPYLLTGDYYYLDEEYQGASFCTFEINPDPAPGGGGGFFAFVNPGTAVTRLWAWGLQVVGRAAFLAPDRSPESNYYNSVVNSNIEVQEGFMAIRGTALTPSSTNTGCSSFSAGTANRWDWGRCGNASLCSTPACTPVAPGLHSVVAGGCVNGPSDMLDQTRTSDFDQPWMYWMLITALGHLQELGFSQVNSVASETHQRLIEMILDPGFNPYLIAEYVQGLKQGPGKCKGGSTTNPFFTSWAQVKSSFLGPAQNIHSFAFTPFSGNFPCADHGYSTVARAAGTYITKTSSGSMTGSAAWDWLNAKAPYLGACGDSIIKFALVPR